MMSIIRRTFKIDGVATDMTSVKLSDSTGTYGVKRNDTDAVVVADGTAMTNIGTGIYEYEFADPAYDLTYTYVLEVAYGGETYWVEATLTGPTSGTEPITTAEAKSHMRVDTTADDTLIGQYITAARRYMERRMRRKFINATVVEKFDDWQSVFRPVYSPLVSVTSIVYVDTGGTNQTLDAAYYTVDTTTEPGRIYEAYSYAWPSARDQKNAITLTYVAGYGASASDVPDTIKTAIKMLVAHWYENREAIGDTVGEKARIPLAIESLMAMEGMVEAV